MCKKVQFSCQVEFVSTFASEEYDRTAQEVAKLTYKDMLELLTMKSQWRREMERMLAERAALEGNSTTSVTSSASTSGVVVVGPLNNENSPSNAIHNHHQQQEICI